MMTNKDRYKQAFQTLHYSGDISLEVKKVEENKRVFKMKPAVIICICAILVSGSMVTAYAADIGGIREKINGWIHGKQVEVDVSDNQDGGYTFSYEEDGTTKSFGGGGVSIDAFGNEEQLSAEDVLENSGTEVDVDDQGKIWLYHYEHKVDITDLFNEDGVCKVAIEQDGKIVYFDIKMDEDGGNEMKQSSDPIGSADDYITVE